MKKLGIIGGAGPLASALLYETLVRESYRLKSPCPEILLLNYPFTRGLTPEEKERGEEVVRSELRYCIEALEEGGAKVGLLVCNTLHLELAKAKVDQIRFLPIPTLVLEEIRSKGGKRVLLLATQNTSLSSLYDEQGVKIVRPSLEGQRVVDGAIDRVLEGKFFSEDAAAISELIDSFASEIDGVILGCTDLPVLDHHCPLQTTIPIYDSVKIPAKTILRYL